MDFVKLIFISAMIFLGCSLPSVNSLKCISMNNQECKVKPQIANVFPFSIKISKYSDSSNNINDPYAKLCVPDVVEVFNLMSRATERRHIE